jgi:hypothetical protein
LQDVAGNFRHAEEKTMCPSQLPRLRGFQASEYLEQVHGILRKPATLAKYRCVGGGPRFQHARRVPYYTPTELDAYALSILSPLKAFTGDLCAGVSREPGNPQDYQTDRDTTASIVREMEAQGSVEDKLPVSLASLSAAQRQKTGDEKSRRPAARPRRRNDAG